MSREAWGGLAKQCSGLGWAWRRSLWAGRRASSLTVFVHRTRSSSAGEKTDRRLRLGRAQIKERLCQAPCVSKAGAEVYGRDGGTPRQATCPRGLSCPFVGLEGTAGERLHPEGPQVQF